MIKMDDAGLYKRLGLDDDATPEMALAAMRGYMQKHDEVEAAKKMADDDEKKKKDDGGDDTAPDGTVKASKMADDDADADKKKMDDADAMKKMDDDVAYDDDTAMKKMAKDLGCEPKLGVIAEAVGLLKLSHTPKSELAKMSKRMAELESKLAKQDEVTKRDEAVTFAKKAIVDGRWNPKEETDLVEARMENPKLAEKALSPKGTWTVLGRLTLNGEILGKERAPSESFDTVEDEGADQGSKVSAMAKKYAEENKIPFAEALNHIANTQPQLYSRAIRR